MGCEMFKIYCDEAGNTGGNLGDAHQRIFGLCAVIVSDTQESQLVCDLRQAVVRAFPVAVPHGFELHATDLFSGKGCFTALSEQNRLKLARDWLEAAQRHNCKVAFRFLDKPATSQHLGSRILSSTAPQFHPYSIVFPQLAPAIDHYIRSVSNNSQGCIVFDENKEVAKWMQKMMAQHCGTAPYAPFPPTVQRIIPTYRFADSKSLVQLQLCDLCAYVLSKQAAKTKHGTRLKPGMVRVCAKVKPLVLP